MGEAFSPGTPLGENFSGASENSEMDIIESSLIENLDDSTAKITTKTRDVIKVPTQQIPPPQKVVEKKLFNVASDKYNFNNVYVYIEKSNNQDIGRLHPLTVEDILHKKIEHS
uniref:Uncharacterized protein LOC114341389 n=1 Tax=Diabrotica virgifera virgifera TaxID=50390 RepID=A0A6P7GRS7_DIAVI